LRGRCPITQVVVCAAVANWPAHQKDSRIRNSSDSAVIVYASARGDAATSWEKIGVGVGAIEPPRVELYRACATNEPGELVGGLDAVCSAERQATYGAARLGRRQAVTGDDAICQIGSLRNGAIEGPTTPKRHCHRRSTCLAHGWACVAHVGDRARRKDRAQKGPSSSLGLHLPERVAPYARGPRYR